MRARGIFWTPFVIAASLSQRRARRKMQSQDRDGTKLLGSQPRECRSAQEHILEFFAYPEGLDRPPAA
jgi:hypothetical protein